MESGNPKSTGHIVEDGWETASVMSPSGAQFKLGKSSVWVWKSCNGSATRPKIVSDFAKEFNIGSEQSQTTVETILCKLQDLGLVSVRERKDEIPQKPA